MTLPIYYYTGVAALNGTLALIVGAFVWSRDPKDGRYVTYGVLCLSLAVWSFGYFMWLLSHTHENALFWVKFLMAGAVVVPMASYHHIIQLIGTPDKVKHILIRTGYAISAGLVLLLPTSLLVSGVTPKLNFKFWPDPGPAYHFHSVTLVFFASMIVYELYRAYGTAVGRRRNHLRWLLATVTLSYMGATTNVLLWYDIPFPPLGDIFVSIYIGVFAYGILVHRLLDIEVLAKKSLVYGLVLLGLLVPCYLVVIWGQELAFGTINYTFSMFTLLLFIVVGFVFPKIRFTAEEALERALFQKRVDYRETLLRSSKEMVSIVDLENLSNSLVKTVSRALGTETASLYLLDEAKGVYNLKASMGREKELYPKIRAFQE